MELTIAFNERSTLYEVHARGCRHLMARHLEATYHPEGDPATVAAEFEAGNEECLTKLGPCARRPGLT